jgi:hypothetical protein
MDAIITKCYWVDQCFGLILIFLLITHQSENKSQHVQPEILKYLLAQDEANERRFNQWIQNHKQQIPTQNITQNFDNWTSEPFPMAIITALYRLFCKS